MITIRQASVNDAEAIASCLLLAMDTIMYQFIGEENERKAEAFLAYFANKENNQYSYQNCWVAEKENIIIAAANIYDGATLEELRLPVLQYLKKEFGNDINPEDETEAGEFYIDSIGVQTDERGKGVGSQMLQFLVDEYAVRRGKNLGLLVEEANASAKRLYIRLGFKRVGEKIFMGKKMEHLQLKGKRK